MDLNTKRFCLPYSTFTMDLNAEMVKLLTIQDNVSQMEILRRANVSTSFHSRQPTYHSSMYVQFERYWCWHWRTWMYVSLHISTTLTDMDARLSSKHPVTDMFLLWLISWRSTVTSTLQGWMERHLSVAVLKGNSPIVSQLITAHSVVDIVLKKHGMTPLFNDEGRDILLLWYNSLLLVPTSTFLRQQLGQHRFSLLQKMGTLPS
jgi:hypothetical protein